MKTISTSIIAVLAIAAFSFSACKKVETCDLQAELDAYQQKIMQFNANPTTSNCNILKQASLDLLNEAEECTGADKQAILTATNAWKDVDCSGF